MTKQQAALDALKRIDREKHTPGYGVECKALYEGHADTIREALTQAQNLSMKEPGWESRSAETKSDAAPIINKAGGVPSPDMPDEIFAHRGYKGQQRQSGSWVNDKTPIYDLPRTSYTRTDLRALAQAVDAFTKEHIHRIAVGAAKSCYDRHGKFEVQSFAKGFTGQIFSDLTSLQSGAGLEALLAKVPIGKSLHVWPIEGAWKAKYGDERIQRNVTRDTPTSAIEAAMKESGNG